jgi:hypothetical protein
MVVWMAKTVRNSNQGRILELMTEIMKPLKVLSATFISSFLLGASPALANIDVDFDIECKSKTSSGTIVVDGSLLNNEPDSVRFRVSMVIAGNSAETLGGIGISGPAVAACDVHPDSIAGEVKCAGIIEPLEELQLFGVNGIQPKGLAGKLVMVTHVAELGRCGESQTPSACLSDDTQEESDQVIKTCVVEVLKK